LGLGFGIKDLRFDVCGFGIWHVRFDLGFAHHWFLYIQNVRHACPLITMERLVGWCLMALSAQKGYIVPCEK